MKLTAQAKALKTISATIPQILENTLIEFSIGMTSEDGCSIHVVRAGIDGSQTTYHRVAQSIVVFAKSVQDVAVEIERAEKQEQEAIKAKEEAAKRQRNLNGNARGIAIQIGEFNEEISGYEKRLTENLKAKEALAAVNLNHAELDRRIERDRAAISTLKIGRDIDLDNLDRLYKQGAQRYYTNGEPFNGDPNKAEPVKDKNNPNGASVIGYCGCGCGKPLYSSTLRIGDDIVAVASLFEPSPSDESDAD